LTQNFPEFDLDPRFGLELDLGNDLERDFGQLILRIKDL